MTSFSPNHEFDDRAFTACCLSARHLGSPGSRFQGTTLRRLLSRYPLKSFGSRLLFGAAITIFCPIPSAKSAHMAYTNCNADDIVV